MVGALSTLRVSLQFYKRHLDCMDLSLKWQKLARDYTHLREDVYREGAIETLDLIDSQADELSKTGMATGKPDSKRLAHWWNYVFQHHRAVSA